MLTTTPLGVVRCVFVGGGRPIAPKASQHTGVVICSPLRNPDQGVATTLGAKNNCIRKLFLGHPPPENGGGRLTGGGGEGGPNGVATDQGTAERKKNSKSKNDTHTHT